MANFWWPRYKYEFVKWFSDMNIMEENKAKKMSLKQLKGKYFEYRNKLGR